MPGQIIVIRSQGAFSSFQKSPSNKSSPDAVMCDGNLLLLLSIKAYNDSFKAITPSSTNNLRLVI
jgi:hypothetical protein